MRLTRILPAALVVLALSACGGAAPTAADPGITPRMNGGGGTGSGTYTEDGTSSTTPGTSTVAPADTTQTGVNRGGFIGSGT